MHGCSHTPQLAHHPLHHAAAHGHGMQNVDRMMAAWHARGAGGARKHCSGRGGSGGHASKLEGVFNDEDY